MPTSKQDQDFSRIISEGHIDEVKISYTALDSAIDWISSEFDPDDIFDTKKLEAWAEENGYTKE